MSQDLGEEGVVRVRLRYNIHGVVQEARIAQSSGSKNAVYRGGKTGMLANNA